ncbi:hypothetical protein [Paraburkholderia sp. GAS82]|uniref:hypothetical protein n=1 Tax=Paraburkholderia sp. GAS82 TaxID=3035137 RepID=UPI003D22D543
MSAVGQQANVWHLRRAVADLSRCSIEDIEAIWAALSASEREKLRPLLAKTPYLSETRLDSLQVAGKVSNEAVASDYAVSEVAAGLARVGAALPNELMSRLLCCFDAQTREAVVKAMPADRQAFLTSAATRAYGMTEGARAALRKSAFTAIEQTEPSEPLAAPMSAPFGHKIRRWLGRQA